MYDILILGGGPAGLSAAIYGARAGLRVAVMEKTAAGGQIVSTHRLENYPGFAQGISGPEFSESLRQQAARFGVEWIAEEAVEADLRPMEKRVTGKRGVYTAKSVILAMGAAPRKLQVPGEEAFTGMGVSYCATCDGAFFRGMRVAVVGGGDTAFEDALYLADLAAEVYLVHRREQFRAQQYLVDRAAHAENIHFVKNAVPVEIGGGMDLSFLRLQNTATGVEETLEVEGVFVAIGQQPSTLLVAGQVALDPAGYVIAGEDTKTNLPGVFAAGDLRQKPLRQVVTAAADGAVAAMQAHAACMHQE